MRHRRLESADHSRWVLRFNARAGRDGRWEVAAAQITASTPISRALAELLQAGPIPAVDGVVRWRRKPGAVALGDVRHLARRDHGRARVEGARLRQDLGAAAPLRVGRRTLGS